MSRNSTKIIICKMKKKIRVPKCEVFGSVSFDSKMTDEGRYKPASCISIVR